MKTHLAYTSIKMAALMMAAATAIVGAGSLSPTLKDAYKKDFRIGVALNQRLFSDQDSRGAEIVKAEFNSISPENVLKWESVHPRPGTYNFDPADRYVEFGVKNHMFVIGHTLIWHNQTPAWVFQGADGKPASREVLLERMRDHIQTVAGRYKGRINGWDVVNEAINEDGSMRQTPWLKIIGDDYIEKAYQFAHEADPAAELYYNEYGLENEQKRNGALKLIGKLVSEHIPIAAVGLQGHYRMDWPKLEQIDDTIAAFAKLGVKVNITELDVDVLPPASTYRGADITLNVKLRSELNPYPDGLPDSVQQALARRYADLFDVFLKHRAVMTRVTLWGLTDQASWLNNWPVRGRTNYPLLFDREGQPKPAFDAVVRAATKAARSK
ncbi:MAG TPA: endo-1,4-beta-xylanase [Blastocatellia bacterium]|nr:endo-1,4-beta-xylanase [Blastocatellia bacterium]